jgi:hypothetical protein
VDVIFTIVSRNYGAQAACLMESLGRVEPGVRRVVVTTDGPIAFKDPGVRTIDAAYLVPGFPAMCAYYDALELNTAVKPHAFKALLAEEGVTSAAYLDPDIWVYRPLDLVREGLARAPLALTPHTTRPLLGQANPNDHVILTSGAYNLGFMAARAEPQIEALLDWWAEKLRFDCRVDFANGLFTDQKWMDLAPGFVSDLALLRSPALNLAYWNLEGREVAKAADGWSVDGEPLAFFHFSGFDPARPELLSKHQDRVRVTPGTPLAELMKDYAAALLRNGHAAASVIPYAHRAFPSGRPITHEIRRRMLDAARAGEDFGGGLTHAGEAWSDIRPGEVIREPTTPPDGAWLAGSAELTRWLIADQTAPVVAAMSAARRDLRDRFGGDEEGLKAWLLGPESLEGRFSARLAPASAFADQELALRAARHLNGDASGTKLLLAAYGLAHRADWPGNVATALRSSFNSPVRELARGHPFPRLFLSIWESRGDLQRLFPLSSFGERFAFLRWLIGGGLAEYGIDVAALPPNVDSHPVFELARLSVRRSPGVELRQPPAGAINTLLVLERWTPGAAGGDALVFDASANRFRTPEGAPAPTPARVEKLVYRTDRGLVPADAIALLSQGVTWGSASA